MELPNHNKNENNVMICTSTQKKSVFDKMAKKHECPLCDYSVKDKCNLRTHINVMHTRKNLYQCTACDFKTYSDGSLRNHEKNLHPKEVSSQTIK